MPKYENSDESIVAVMQEFKMSRAAMANQVVTLRAEVRAANARERRAFVAGYNRVNNDADSDLEQAWQQYRCQDDTDWKATGSSQRSSNENQN